MNEIFTQNRFIITLSVMVIVLVFIFVLLHKPMLYLDNLLNNRLNTVRKFREMNERKNTS